jgi:mannose-6-phosphate isomerase class I
LANNFLIFGDVVEVIVEKDKRTIKPVPHVVIDEYDMHNTVMNGATATIKGRYPERGFVVNRKVDEIVYVLEGCGTLTFSTGQKISYSKGDVIFVEKEEKYAWDGDMRLFMVCTPPFDPAQHDEVED